MVAADAPGARAQVRRALALAPRDAELLIEGGALERWQGDWSLAQERLDRALGQSLSDAQRDRVGALRAGIRDLSAPTLTAAAARLQDSNGITRTDSPGRLTIPVNGRWTVGAEVLRGAIQSDAAATATGTAFVPFVVYRPRRALQLEAALGAEGTPGAPLALHARVSAQRVWTARGFALARLTAATATATDAAEALDRGLARTTLTAEGYAEPSTALTLGGQLGALVYSDDNQRVQAALATRWLPLSVGRRAQGLPRASAGVTAGVLYEDSAHDLPRRAPLLHARRPAHRLGRGGRARRSRAGAPPRRRARARPPARRGVVGRRDGRRVQRGRRVRPRVPRRPPGGPAERVLGVLVPDGRADDPAPAAMTRAALLLLAAAVAGCLTPPPDYGAVDRASRRSQLVEAETFATVLSRRANLDSLAVFDLVILDPDPYQAADLAGLRARGVQTLGYVNVGELEDWRRFADRVDPAWVLGENPHWPGHRFVDARELGWQALVVGEVAAAAVAKEFDGLFLDMADVASPWLFPETADGVVALIRALREAYPTHLLVLNRGLFLVDQLGPDLDGLLVEGVWGRADLAAGAYVRTPDGESGRLLGALNGFRDATGGAVFAIDYADTADLRAHVLASARRARIPVFVSTTELADLPPAGGLAP